MSKGRAEQEPLLTVTVLLTNSDGDCLCMNCKRTFGVIWTDASFPGADDNYCPHCGAKVLEVSELDADVGFYDIKKVER